MTRAIMIQGTGSNVGKSLIVAGILRALRRRGLNPAPFKPQNMSNNAAVCPSGGEIGRAQALQARAAGIDPTVDMNPVLLKPESETGAQVIVRGQRAGRLGSTSFADRAALLPVVLDSFRTLARTHGMIVVEGAGSPAETNLRAGDIANMGFARAAQVPVVLLGDIDRGGVIAQIVGTHAVLDPDDRAMVRGFAINKFRGDKRLFDAGLVDIQAATGWPSLGVLGWAPEAARLPAEDALDLRSSGDGACLIAVPHLPCIANFDDLDPLAAEPGVSLRIVATTEPIPAEARLVLLPGSKATIADLHVLRDCGWDIDIRAHVRRGGHVLGICGGYQMLGRELRDDAGIEGPPERVQGLGLLDVVTTLHPQKRLSLTRATEPLSGTELQGYEIHMGETHGPDSRDGWLRVDGRAEGARDATGRIMGTYLHGIFASDPFRRAFLSRIGVTGTHLYEPGVDAALDALADRIEAELDLNALIAASAPVRF